MRENERNLLLRRIDWRFLLPDPAPRTSLALSEELAEPLELITRVSRTPGDDEVGFDLAAVVDPSPSDLVAAWSTLRPRGSVYTEWREPIPGGWKAIVRKLGAAGFEEVACFWPRPDPARAPTTAWIPLESRAPLDYYRTRRRNTRSPWRLAGRAVRRIQWRLRTRRPVCAIARKPPVSGPRPGSTERESLLETIRRSWNDWGLGPPPRRIARLLRAAPGRSSGKVVAFLFAEDDPKPRVVVKAARTPEAGAGLEREVATLRALASRSVPVFGIPKILDSRPDGIVVETALPGLPLPAFLDRRGYRGLASKATTWLVELAGPDDGSRGSRAGFVDGVLQDFETRFGDVLDPGLLRAGEELLATLPPLRTVCEQRDFSPWNILVTRAGALSVLDWESSETRGVPALDLIYFLTYQALYFDRALRRGRHRASFRKSLEPSSLTGGATKECLERYSEQTNLPKAALAPLRILAWLLHSRSEYRHLEEDAGGAPDPQRLRRSFFVDLLTEEIRYTSWA
jgi:hypothetical protein